MKSLLAITIVLTCPIVLAQDTASIALHRLMSVEVFAFGGVGYSGVRSQGEKDYKTITTVPRSQAITALEELYAAGNPQAKSYALAGFRKVDPTRFNELLTSLRDSRLKVQTERGCIVSTRPMFAIAHDLASGEFDSLLR